MKFIRVVSLFAVFAASLLWAACSPPPEVGAAANFTGPEENESAQPAEWLHDYEQALSWAAEQNRPVLLNFTGSDWCPPCMRLKSEVFDDAIFARYASAGLVLVELDYPRSVEQSDELIEQNQSLQQRYRIEGFPTLIVLDSEGKELRRHVGYMPGGTRAFVRWLEG
jgi:thioredoxin-related protein